MNKQYVIAALLATTQAAPCADAYTKLADAELATATSSLEAARNAKKAADEIKTKATEAMEAEQKLYDPVNKQVEPFITHFNDADKAAKDAKAAHDAADKRYSSGTETIQFDDTVKDIGLWNNANVKMSFTAKNNDVVNLEKAYDAAGVAKGKADDALKVLQAEKVKFDAEYERRKAQFKIYETDASNEGKANEAAAAAKKVVAQWTEAKKLATAALDGKIDTLLADAQYDKLAKTDLETMLQWRKAEDAYTNEEVTTTQKKKAMTDEYDKVKAHDSTAIKAALWRDKVFKNGDVCDSDFTKCKTGDGVHDDYTTENNKLTQYDADVKKHGELKTEYITQYAKGLAKKQVVDDFVIDLKAITDKYAKTQSDAEADASYNAAEPSKAAKGEAETAMNEGEKDCKATDAAITAQEAEIARLTDNVTVANHIHQLAKDRFEKLKAAEAKAKGVSDRADAQRTLANTAMLRAQAKLKTYKDAYDGAKVIQQGSESNVKTTESDVSKAEAKQTACQKKQAAAIANCKGYKYKEAQIAYQTWKTKSDAATSNYDAMAAEYAKETNAPTDGSANTRCEIPKKDAEGVQKPRPKCLDELCCGSANKYMRDGTRLTVETCQNEKGTHSYTFWPKLKKGATAKPQAEMWRFYCIEGAQKLAATLAAGLGAVYFMA